MEGQPLGLVGSLHVDDIERASHVNFDEQYGDADALRKRFGVYECAMDGLPVTQDRIFNMLAYELKPGETLLDVGCADRSFLGRVRQELYHRGRLIGNDIVDMRSDVNDQLIKQGFEPVEFRLEAASKLSLEPGSVNKMTVMFSAYYDPEALALLFSLLSENGVMYMAVPGKENKKRQRFWEDFATKHIRAEVPDLADLQPPPIHAAPFDADRAEQELPKFFDHVEHIPQNTFMKIDDEDSQEKYRNSLLSMYPSLTPYWHRAIDNKVMPLVRQEIAENGFYLDVIDRHIFKATKAAHLRAA